LIDRVFRIARSFQEAEEIDRHDMDALSLEERIRAVERLRQLAASEVTQLYVNGPTLHAPPPSDAGSSDAARE
jgi:hypothetical protein